MEAGPSLGTGFTYISGWTPAVYQGTASAVPTESQQNGGFSRCGWRSGAKARPKTQLPSARLNRLRKNSSASPKWHSSKLVSY